MFKVRISVCLGLLLLTLTIRAQEKPSDIPLDNPFTTFSAPQVSETKMSGAIVTIIKDGDIVHPTFSPDGKILAYANVLLKGEFENTEVVLHDLSTNKRSDFAKFKKGGNLRDV